MKRTSLFVIAMCFSMMVMAQTAGEKTGSAQVLPEITYSVQPAVLKGKVQNNKDGRLPAELRILCTPTWCDEAMEQAVSLDEQGAFEARFDVLCNSRATLVGEEGQSLGSFFLVPGEEVRLTIDAKKLSKAEDEAKMQAAVKCEGALADLNNGLINFHEIYTEYRLMSEINGTGLTILKGLDASGFKQKILQIYNDGIQKLQKDKRLTPAYREYVTRHYQYICTAMLSGAERLLRYANQGGEYPLPEGYFDEVKDWNFASSNAFVYAHGGGVKALGEQVAELTGSTFVLPSSAEPAAKAAAYMSRIDGLNPLNADELQQAAKECPVFFPMLREKNDRMLATIEENKSSNKLNVKEIATDVKGEDVFRTITADYREKMTLVDFWATWCGPCRKAMETILPVKEQLWGKVNFVYVTGETSPKETWNKMMQTIHGDHYYLTSAQWNDLLGQFDVQGIPAYIVVDRDGNVVNKYIGYPGNEKILEELSK